MREMSARSGINEATLRMWEVRHGFPKPRRVSSGHRRYSEADVARVRAVVRARERGLSLQAAIELAHDAGEQPPPSVYASLRARYPELEPQLLSKRAMLWMSHAIEDECLARAERPLLFGCLPARALLPQLRASVARARAHGRARGGAGRLRARPAAAGGADRGPDRARRSSRPRVGDRVRVPELRRVPRGVGASRRRRESRRARVRGGVDGRGAGGPPGGAGLPAARLRSRARSARGPATSASTRRRSPASTSSARRSSSVRGWSGTRPRHSGPIPAAASAASQYAHSAARFSSRRAARRACSASAGAAGRARTARSRAAARARRRTRRSCPLPPRRCG